jgi:hypothetical protein
MKVREKRAKDAWSSSRYEEEIDKKSSEVKAPKVLNDEEIQTILGSMEKPKQEIIRRAPAPFFGPARKMGKTKLLL